jgi:hypothetical protein
MAEPDGQSIFSKKFVGPPHPPLMKEAEAPETTRGTFYASLRRGLIRWSGQVPAVSGRSISRAELHHLRQVADGPSSSRASLAPILSAPGEESLARWSRQGGKVLADENLPRSETRNGGREGAHASLTPNARRLHHGPSGDGRLLGCGGGGGRTALDFKRILHGGCQGGTSSGGMHQASCDRG